MVERKRGKSPGPKKPRKQKTTKNVSNKIPVRIPSPSRASDKMSLTELQNMAKSKGIPFGGLSRAHLMHKINNYLI